MGNTFQLARAQFRACRSALNYQCRVCTADSETEIDQLNDDPTRTMSNVGLIKEPMRNKYF